jgi:hypothetical protein
MSGNAWTIRKCFPAEAIVNLRLRNLNEPNIELSSAADYNQKPKFLTGQYSLQQPALKATAPTICYGASNLTRPLACRRSKHSD